VNRVDRLLGLILYLQSRRGATAARMAEHFGLSVRTIYRDLRALGEAGVPVVGEAGVGYSLLKGYHLPPVNFTREEAFALVTGGLFAQRFGGPGTAGHVASALSKVRAVLPPAGRENALRLEQGLGAAAVPSQPEEGGLACAQAALAERRVLRFDYAGYARPGTLAREVEPLGLIHYLGRWHLIAWCRLRDACRDFRIDRMRNPRLLPQTFAPREGFSLAEFLRVAMPEPALRARVFFRDAVLDRARREWWPGIDAASPASGGSLLTLRVLDWEHLAGWLLAFGREVRVHEPESLRLLVVELARAAREHHGEPPPPDEPA